MEPISPRDLTCEHENIAALVDDPSYFEPLQEGDPSLEEVLAAFTAHLPCARCAWVQEWTTKEAKEILVPDAHGNIAE